MSDSIDFILAWNNSSEIQWSEVFYEMFRLEKYKHFAEKLAKETNTQGNEAKYLN